MTLYSKSEPIQPNDRVEHDHATGMVLSVEGDLVTVYWYDSGKRTTQPAALLKVVSS